MRAGSGALVQHTNDKRCNTRVLDWLTELIFAESVTHNFKHKTELTGQSLNVSFLIE